MRCASAPAGELVPIERRGRQQVQPPELLVVRQSVEGLTSGFSSVIGRAVGRPVHGGNRRDASGGAVTRRLRPVTGCARRDSVTPRRPIVPYRRAGTGPLDRKHA